MFLHVHVLGDRQHLGGFSAGNHYHSIGIRGHDVPGVHGHTIANDRKICSDESIVIHDCRRRRPQGKNRESKFLQISDIADASINHGAGKVS